MEVSVATLLALPRAHARRLIRQAIAQAKGDLRRIEFQHVESVLHLATRPTGDGRVSLPGVNVCRSFGWLRIAPTDAPPIADPVAVRIPGDCLAPDRETRIHFELSERAGIPSCDTLKAELWWKKILDPVEVRGWRPGDRYRPVGETRDQKLKDMFQQLRIPSWKRPGWPIVTSGVKILWARGFGPAAEVAAGVAGGEGPVLRVWEGRAGPF